MLQPRINKARCCFSWASSFPWDHKGLVITLLLLLLLQLLFRMPFQFWWLSRRSSRSSPHTHTHTLLHAKQRCGFCRVVIHLLCMYSTRPKSLLKVFLFAFSIDPSRIRFESSQEQLFISLVALWNLNYLLILSWTTFAGQYRHFRLFIDHFSYTSLIRYIRRILDHS